MIKLKCTPSPSRAVMSLSITAFPNPIPQKLGSTTTSQIIALNTPSPVALANDTGLFVFSFSTHRSASVCSNATRIFPVSRRGNPTATNTVLRWLRSRLSIVQWRVNPRDDSDSSEIENFVASGSGSRCWAKMLAFFWVVFGCGFYGD